MVPCPQMTARIVEGMDEGAAFFDIAGAGPHRRLRRNWRREG